MSQLINVSDEVYEELTKLKKIRDASYSELIKSLMHAHYGEKTEAKGDLLAYLGELEKKYKGKQKENISERIDDIVYG